ncbi:VanW family protein [Corynebacterium mucifaciens]|nr:VanW family protein [Corynebacterium mucifaciens]NKY69326.1 hypothetical protein [Corynebacterium mucifaciens]
MGRGSKIALGTFLGILAVVLALYLADLAMHRGDVPRGTHVGGVNIGAMAPADAKEKLKAELGGTADEAVMVRAGEQRAEFVPAQSGLGIDFDATVDAAGIASANPVERLRRLFTTREVDVVPTVDDVALNHQLDRLVGELHVDPADGVIRIEGGKAETQDPKPGQDVERTALRDEVTTGWLNPDGVEVEPTQVQPAVDEAAMRAALDGPVRAALDGPVTVTGKDEFAAAVPQDRLGEIVQFPVVDGRIAPSVNQDAARAILGEQLVQTEVEGQNARVLEGGGVEPSVDGSVVDWDATMDGFSERVLGSKPRAWDAVYKDVPAQFTTAQAENATFNDVVGSFTTGGYSGASGTNIALVASTVNGAIVNPGETFSLNGYTGPRGTAQGYVESGIILDGHADTAVGGGISQFATTLYNASYFAGMTDVAHTPHSYYISRYPAGREATVYEGAIDLQFRNDSPYPVRIATSVGGGEVTVSLMGVKTVTVDSINGGRWAETAPEPMSVPGSNCVPSSGTPGFTTSDTRVIYDLAGNELSRETQTTVYDPQPIVRCS